MVITLFRRTLSTVCFLPQGKQQLFLAIGLSLLASSALALEPACEPVIRADWTTFPSTYTHDNQGRRVDTYAVTVAPQVEERLDFQRSGFRHTRSTLQAGASVDNFHVVEKWGPPVQPYGEWRYPFRPFAVPYSAWGPQLPLVTAQGQRGWFGPGGVPYPPYYPGAGQAGPGMGANPNPGMGGFPGYPGFDPSGFGPWGGGGVGPFHVGPQNALRPDQDDYYAPVPEPPPISDRDFFFSPRP